ncbi:MAG: flotillin family protein [Leucothrix sp.]
MVNTLIILGFIVVLILVVGAAFVAFYTRATKETAFVRTGFGGEKVFINNGGFVFPVLHEKIDVNMKTLKIVISRANDQSLRTKDRIRININSEFFLRVEPTPESISKAAQTLGGKTLEPEALKDQVEGRCDDALRRAAVLMNMEELNDNRSEFGTNVEEGVKVDLEKMGLMLESVALTQLNQTDLEFFNVENAFDAQGRTYVLQKIADNEKQQNAVQNAKVVAIKEADLAAHNRQLDLEKAEAIADQEQAMVIAERKLQTDRQIEQARIQTEIELEEAKRAQAIALAAAQKAAAEAWIDTDEVKAEAAAKQEEITTAKDRAQAERNRIIEVISAEKEAERQKIFAIASADADVREAEASRVRWEVEAEGKTKVNAAANTLSKEQVNMQIKTSIVHQLPDIIRQSVKPMKNIEGIKIMQVDGFSNVIGRGGAAGGGSGAASTSGSSGGGGGSLADQVVDSALRYRAQAPMVESLLNEVGLNGGSIKELAKGLQREMKPEKHQSVPELGSGNEPEVAASDMEGVETGVMGFGSMADADGSDSSGAEGVDRAG